MSDVAFEAKGLSKRFGRRTVLDGLDLTVHTGEVLVLLGENGAGKSTLMRCALGLLRPDGGTLTVLGRDPVRQAADVRDRVGYVPDVPASSVDDRPRPAFLRPHYKLVRRARGRAGRGAPACHGRRLPPPRAARHEGHARRRARRPRAPAPQRAFAGLDPWCARRSKASCVGSTVRSTR
jgi:hypothetical protein